MGLNPGDVVIVEFPGAQGVKLRPAVVLSTPAYHAARPDVVLGLLTSRLAAALTPVDQVLQDWSAAGLRTPSAFRCFLATLPATSVRVVGRLSDRDWTAVQARLSAALAFS